MTSTPPVGEPEQQWQQPAFGSQGSEPQFFTPDPGQAVVPAPANNPVRYSRPPSVAESVVATLAGLVWPVMIVLAIMGVVGWWPGVLVALVAGVVLGNARRHLRARRKALGRVPIVEERNEEGLR